MSEMNIKERVARTIAAYSEGLGGDWRRFIPQAEAVISAMREPTEAMCEPVRGHLAEGYNEIDDVMCVWQMMIDEALKP